MIIGSNRNINKAKVYHLKSWSRVTSPGANAVHVMYPMKSPDDKSIKDYLPAQHEHAVGNEKCLLKNTMMKKYLFHF